MYKMKERQRFKSTESDDLSAFIKIFDSCFKFVLCRENERDGKSASFARSTLNLKMCVIASLQVRST